VNPFNWSRQPYAPFGFNMVSDGNSPGSQGRFSPGIPGSGGHAVPMLDQKEMPEAYKEFIDGTERLRKGIEDFSSDIADKAANIYEGVSNSGLFPTLPKPGSGFIPIVPRQTGPRSDLDDGHGAWNLVAGDDNNHPSPGYRLSRYQEGTDASPRAFGFGEVGQAPGGVNSNAWYTYYPSVLAQVLANSSDDNRLSVLSVPGPQDYSSDPRILAAALADGQSIPYSQPFGFGLISNPHP
jgi:hypothetical protein